MVRILYVIPHLMPGFLHLLILMVVIWSAGRLSRQIGLPEVFGELLGGIVVGPALLGLVSSETEVIRVLAELGIFFLMVHTGLKIDPKELLQASGKSAVLAAGGTLIPFAGGYLASIALGLSPMASVFIALGISISALPLAARLFKDTKTEDMRVAHVTLGAAIIIDIVALIAFSLVVGIANGGSADVMTVLRLLLSVTAFFAGVIIAGFVFQRYLPVIMRRGNRSFTMTLILALCIGLLAEWAGLHMIIGAFLAGLFIREEVIEPKIFERIEDRYYALTYGFFGPIFFASLAFHFDPGIFIEAPLQLAVLTIVATVTKLIGVGGAAMLTGLSWRESLFSGVAMNARGAMELVIASVGLQTGIINETVFSVLVAVTLLTTIPSLFAGSLLAKGLKAHTPAVPA